ncbi:5361_t:CDS:2 [Ambispora gerdemannii]|uniref:5361_t:CDS:1 n=1 Tax=Ambispora gerdemannii TaxID=144530 RepID=A0A9N9AHW3_9GLOM|nr:5361_t:CDS:2 [Ambispora gerdemannii]
MDNYFSSIPLFRFLWQNGIGACGTVQKTSASFPKELKLDKDIKLDWDVRSGVVVNDVLVVLWQDNRPDTMLSIIHGITGEETGKTMTKGNKHQCSKDITDQLRSYYSTQKIIRTAGSMQKQQEFRHELVWNLINFANDTDEFN